jgi:hypothetical protein
MFLRAMAIGFPLCVRKLPMIRPRVSSQVKCLEIKSYKQGRSRLHHTSPLNRNANVAERAKRRRAAALQKSQRGCSGFGVVGESVAGDAG